VSRQPAGANNFLKWRRSIVEHLELRRIGWHEFGMLAWLCTKASPQTGILRTSWPTLARETGLSAAHVEQVCRALKRKRYLWYLPHRGVRGRLVEVAIDKYPTADGGYTDLSSRFRPGSARTPRAGSKDSAAELPTDVPMDLPTDVRMDVPTQLLTDVPMELDMETREESHGSPPGRLRQRREKEREREKDRECARAQDRRKGRGRTEERVQTEGRDHTDAPDLASDWREKIATPVAIRELLAAQPWWRLPALDDATASGADPGGTPAGSRATGRSSPPPGGASR
jgi:hypothetical protein